jgi:hypothetical protein
MSDGEFFAWGLVALYFLLVGLWLSVRRRRQRNKRINLPPPSVACRRNSTEATP